jgi:hypothetical protein
VIAAELLARTSEGSKAGPIWFAVVLLLCIACYFLFKSMSKHLRNVRENFPQDPAEPPEAQEVELPAPAEDHPVDGKAGDS